MTQILSELNEVREAQLIKANAETRIGEPADGNGQRMEGLNLNLSEGCKD